MVDNVVHKYELGHPMPNQPFSTLLPDSAEIIHVDLQYGVVTLWALIDSTDLASHSVDFVCAATEQAIPQPMFGKQWKHLKTLLDQGGISIWHIFMQVEETQDA